jgi:hypothetical protein
MAGDEKHAKNSNKMRFSGLMRFFLRLLAERIQRQNCRKLSAELNR